MFKSALYVCIGLCVVAAPAMAESNTHPVTLVSTTGLFVRVATPAAMGDVPAGNTCGAAVNTAGVVRATTAVKVGGRVFLTAGRTASLGQTPRVAIYRPQTDAPCVRQSPAGLGTLLASLFGGSGH